MMRFRRVVASIQGLLCMWLILGPLDQIGRCRREGIALRGFNLLSAARGVEWVGGAGQHLALWYRSIFLYGA